MTASKLVAMDTLTLPLMLALAALLGALVALVAVVTGLYFAGRLTGTMGRPIMQLDPDSRAVPGGFADRERAGMDEPGPESVPWDETEPPREGVDPGADPDAWKEAPA